MIKLFLFGALLALNFTSCSTEDNENDIKIRLKSLNVADAQTIFKMESGNAKSALNDGGYWKIDKSGKESKLVLSDSNNSAQGDVTIEKILKLSDDILLLHIWGTYTSTVIEDDQSLETTIDREGFFFANTQTERLFELPSGEDLFYYNLRNLMYSNGAVSSQQDEAGMIYINCGDNIMKLDPFNYTLSFQLPDKQDFDNNGLFYVTSEGFVYYEGFNDSGVFSKIKCPEGRIIPLDGRGFVCNDEIYSFENDSKYHWDKVGKKDLKKIFICEFYDLFDGEEYSLEIYDVIRNYAKETVLLGCRSGRNIYEFDGINPPKLVDNFPEQFRYFEQNLAFDKNKANTKNSLYVFEKSKLFRLDLHTYQFTIVPTPDIEIQEIISDKEQEGFSFTGISYIDGKNIIGTLSG